MLFRSSIHPTPDHELLLRTHRGDARAAKELWSRLGPRLIAYAAGLLRGSPAAASADDVVQAVFCRILETPRADLRAVRDVPAWLTTLTRHAALNLRRAEQRERARRAAAELDPARADPARTSTSDTAPPSVPDDLRAGLDALDDDLREILLLKHAAGLTFDQIALALDQNRNTVASRYRKAVESLRSIRAATRPAAPGEPLTHAGAA